MNTPSKHLLPVPTTFSPSILRQKLSACGSWFYEYNFTCGVSTQASSSVAHAFHVTRAGLIFPLLHDFFDGRWDRTRCLDIACHQGWYSTQLALRGAREVIGFDVRVEHLAMANMIREISGLDNLNFRHHNLFELSTDEIGQFDLTFMLGLLYHIDAPLQALRIARSLTRKICVIETQVARPFHKLTCEWGSSGSTRQGPGIALIPADDTHVEGRRSVVLVPTLEALSQMIYAAGFDRLFVIHPPSDAQEQFANLDRVVVFAHS